MRFRPTPLSGAAGTTSVAGIVVLCAVVTTVQLVLLVDWTESHRFSPAEIASPPEIITAAEPVESDGTAEALPPLGPNLQEDLPTRRIFASVRAERTKALRNPSFAPKVGSRIPRSIRLYPLTSEMNRSLPQFIGHQFLLVDDRILIIEPRQKKIVAVLEDTTG